MKPIKKTLAQRDYGQIRTAFFFVTLCLAPVVSIAAQSWSQVTKNTGPAVAKIEVLQSGNLIGSGSGFVFDASGLVMTNAHVVESVYSSSSNTLKLNFPLSKEADKIYSAEIVHYSYDSDLAILKLAGPYSPIVVLGDSETPELMSEILVAGFPLGKSFKATPGFIQALQDYTSQGSMLDLSAAVDPGNSGGPIFAKNGQVIGIVTAKIMGANFNLALPVRNIRDFIELNKNPINIVVNSVPQGAHVFVNENYQGLSPLSNQVKNRTLHILVQKDGFEALKKTLEIPAGKAVDPSVSYELVPIASNKVKVRLDTQPSGAELWVNNTSVGKSPVEFESDKSRKLRIRARLIGYRELSEERTLNQESEQSIVLPLGR